MNSKTKTIILLGKTGHGKSTFCNLLSDSFEFKVAAETDVNSCTKEIKKKEYDIKEENIKLVIIDTPGFSDSDGDDPNIIKDIKNYLLKKDLPRINSIIVIISIQEPKLDQSIQLFLGAMCQVFPLPKL
jgi:predicted GTPase